MELLIDTKGRTSKIANQDLVNAIYNLGNIHIKLIDDTVLITIYPNIVDTVTMLSASYEIADLNPARSILISGIYNPECWVFSGYLPAIRKMALLVENNRNSNSVSASGFMRVLQ